MYNGIIRGRRNVIPTVIDKTPIHDDAIGWSRRAIRYTRRNRSPHQHSQDNFVCHQRSHAGRNRQQRWVAAAARWILLWEHTYSVLCSGASRGLVSPALIRNANLLSGRRGSRDYGHSVQELIAGLFSAEYRPANSAAWPFAARHLKRRSRFQSNCRCPWMSTSRPVTSIANNLDLSGRLAERAAMSEHFTCVYQRYRL